MAKIAIVTGASRGLGRHTALHIARGGSDVILTYRNRADDARAVVDEIRALGRKALALELDVGATAGFPLFVERVRMGLRDVWQRDRSGSPR
jgi:NAD(P)-dependent dehydrogenase (short-subunit alcohol dehydrogenase family)